MRIIDRAKELQIKVVGLDLPKEKRDTIADNSERLIQRDRHMTGVVRNVLKANRSYKMFVFSGHLHAALVETYMAGILKQEGVKVTTADIVGVINNGELFLDRSVRESGFSSERFMLPARVKYPNGISSPFRDWLIHLPQTESAKDSKLKKPA